MDIKNNTHKVIIGLVVLAVLLGGYSLFVRTTPFEATRDGGRVEINGDEVYKYFTFVSADEARGLLAKARDRGEFAFLFPQIDLDNFDKLVIHEREMTTERGRRVALLGIEGLPADVVVYSNIDGTIRASVFPSSPRISERSARTCRQKGHPPCRKNTTSNGDSRDNSRSDSPAGVRKESRTSLARYSMYVDGTFR